MTLVDNNNLNQVSTPRSVSPEVSSELEELAAASGKSFNFVVEAVVLECIQAKRCSPENHGKLATAAQNQKANTKPSTSLAFTVDLSKADIESLAEIVEALERAGIQAPEIFKAIDKVAIKMLEGANGKTLLKLFIAFEKAKMATAELFSSIKEEFLKNNRKKLAELSTDELVELSQVVAELKPCDTKFVQQIQNVLVQNCGKRLWDASLTQLNSMSKSFTNAGIKDRDFSSVLHHVMMHKYKK